MGNFVRVAEGVDIVPLMMAVERQSAVFNDSGICVLFDGQWTSEYYAFPQLRGLLLDVMRRMECGQLHSVVLTKGGKFGKVRDMTEGVGIVALARAELACGEERILAETGSVTFSPGAEDLELNVRDGCLVVMTFAPMP